VTPKPEMFIISGTTKDIVEIPMKNPGWSNCQQVIAPKTENGSDKISAKTAIPFWLSVVVAFA